MNERIRARIEESLDAKQKLLSVCLPQISQAAAVLVQAYRGGRKAAFFGNGGSAADAQHIAAELVGDYRKRRHALPALALHANTSSMTAIGNDYGYDKVFSHQVAGFLIKGDVAVGLSTSGNSQNVLLGLIAAREIGCATIGLLGRDGGKIASVVDVAIIVPATSTDRIQECHMLIGHIFCELIESAVFP